MSVFAPFESTEVEPDFVFSVDAHTRPNGVHTFSITQSPNTDGYVGYAGPVFGGAVDLWQSSSLSDWRPADENPVLDRASLRWPSVFYDDETLYLAARVDTDSKWQTAYDLLFFGGRIPAPFLSPVGKTRIVLFTSDDGVSFEFKGTLIDRASTDRPKNQNPFLFERANGQPGIVYYAGSNEAYEIRIRTAATVPDLSTASDRVVLSSESLVAAPSVYYDPVRDRYVLLVEQLHETTRKWITVAYPLDGLEQATREHQVLFEDNEACPFPYVRDETLFLFTSRCLSDVRGNQIDGEWEGRLYSYDLLT
jgi:hypothetical protein